jgi:ubiquitin C-terminal hydrolase
MQRQIFCHNKNLILKPFGLCNMGNTCYFNALCQCMMSCTTLTHSLSTVPSGVNNVRDVYGEMIVRRDPAYSMQLWHAMKSHLEAKKHSVLDGRQQDTHEAFMLLMQCFEGLDEVEKLFTHTVQNMKYCFKCETYTGDKVLAKNTFFNVPPTFKNQISSDVIEACAEYIPAPNLESYIFRSVEELHKFTCTNPECKSTSRKVQLTFLKEIPEIIVVLVTKYDQKFNTYFPEFFELPGKHKTLKYRAVGQILHSGSQDGGHYWAHVLRHDGWYNCNDSHYSKIGGFSSCSDTYVVFYEFCA